MTKPGPKPGGALKGTPTGIRFEPALKEKIAQAATAANRSFSDEVSLRLEQSFQHQGVDKDDFGSAKTYALALMLAKAIDEVEKWTDCCWDKDAFTFEQVKLAVQTVMAGPIVEGDANSIPPSYPALRHLPETPEGEKIRGWIGKQIMTWGLGAVCGRQVIDNTRTAQEVLRMAPASTPDTERPGSDYRIALAAAREFRRRRGFALRDLVGNWPLFSWGNWEIQHALLNEQMADTTIALYRWTRGTANNPTTEAFGTRIGQSDSTPESE